MSYKEHTWSILRTISHWTKARLEKLGATVTDNEIIATEDQLWRAGPSVRQHLLASGVLTISGGAPDWVPADAKIYIDLVNDRAWTESDGEVAIDTLLGSDANLAIWWGTSGAYDPVNLTADGYASDGDLDVAATGTARTKLVAGSTFTLRFKQVSDDSALYWGLASADGLQAVYFAEDTARDLHGSSQGGFNETISNITNAGNGTSDKVALTLTPLRGEFATNGSTPSASVLSEADYPTTGDSPLVAFYVHISAGQALQSITIYDSLPSTAGLSALSETGVTNTAPTAITLNAPTTLEYPAAEVVAGSAVLAYSNLTGHDPEGNPLTFTLVNDEGGNFVELSSVVSVGASDLGVGSHTITIRGTDPGGLYVEQEFTITVTA